MWPSYVLASGDKVGPSPVSIYPVLNRDVFFIDGKSTFSYLTTTVKTEVCRGFLGAKLTMKNIVFVKRMTEAHNKYLLVLSTTKSMTERG